MTEIYLTMQAKFPIRWQRSWQKKSITGSTINGCNSKPTKPLKQTWNNWAWWLRIRPETTIRTLGTIPCQFPSWKITLNKPGRKQPQQEWSRLVSAIRNRPDCWRFNHGPLIMLQAPAIFPLAFHAFQQSHLTELTCECLKHYFYEFQTLTFTLLFAFLLVSVYFCMVTIRQTTSHLYDVPLFLKGLFKLKHTLKMFLWISCLFGKEPRITTTWERLPSLLFLLAQLNNTFPKRKKEHFPCWMAI